MFELENLLTSRTESGALTALKRAAEDRYKGYIVSSIPCDDGEALEQEKDFPFEDELEKVLTWWKRAE